jgi:hypothetical protein
VAHQLDDRPRSRGSAIINARTTGDRTILGSISRRGNRYLRGLFVQAAWVVLIKLGPEQWERYGVARRLVVTDHDRHLTLATGAHLHTRLFSRRSWRRDNAPRAALLLAEQWRGALRNPQTTRKMPRCAIGSARNKKAMTMNPSWPDKFGFGDEIR